jgi:homoserine dehydrogenase
MKLALIGFGTVGQGLAELLRDRAADLRDRYGFSPALVAVATGRHGTLCCPAGMDADALLRAAARGSLDHYPGAPGLTRGLDVLALLNASGADTLVEASPTDFRTAQPALDYCRAAFDAGLHVVLANKGPLALAYDDLRAQAAQAGRQLAFEATVMAGTPALRLALDGLAGCHIQAARGILNGTTNYILTQMEAGLPYADALAQAQALGYAEADPSADVDGWDAAGKALILARALFGSAFTLADLCVEGIAALTPADIDAARAAGERWKLIAHVTPEGGSVGPARLPLADPLAGVSGTTNAVTYTTDLLGAVTLIGPGAGRQETAAGLLADLLRIHENS